MAGKGRLHPLDGLRGLAALGVVLLHVWLYTGANAPDKNLTVDRWMGELRVCVLLFFVLSGIAALAMQIVADPNSTVVSLGASGAFAWVLGGLRPLVVTASSSPYIDASRTPSPEGANTKTTATIAPTAAVPPRKTIVAGSGCAPTERSSSQSANPPRTQVPA